MAADERTGADPRPDLLRYATLSAPDVAAELGSRPEGLTTDEADARFEREGPNVIPEQPRAGVTRRLLAQLTHFFARLLWVAAVLAWIGGLPQLAIAIAVVVVVNGVFSFAQEEHAERVTRELARLLPATVAAHRDGRPVPLPADRLVRGDAISLREGDRVPADARLVHEDALRLDLSLLTGESEPVERDAEPWSGGTDPAEARSLVLAGTFVTSGSGRAVVVGTGTRTVLGAIATLTGEVRRRPTPLRRELDHTVRVIGTIAVLVGVVFFVATMWMGQPMGDGFLFSVGVIVALVPEGLLPTLTLSLAMSATRMARHRALVRHLEAVETLGATTVICSDKTGTMTTNQMTVRTVRTAGLSLSASSFGWAPGGTLLIGDVPAPAEGLHAATDLLYGAALCGDARLEQRDGRWVCMGDPTEGALVALAAKGGVDRAGAERAMPRVREFPFGSDRRRMSTVHRRADGAMALFAKGSPETILDACVSVRTSEGTAELDGQARDGVLSQVDELATSGLRVLALARRVFEAGEPRTAKEAERGLELLGLVGLEDPVRPGVPDAVRRCMAAGIRVVMVTGDHPGTAVSVAETVGLGHGRTVLGADLPEEDGPLADLLRDPNVRVLARVLPEQKLRIAASLQAAGEVVAMTGDGVNDAPALRQADIGVAMGLTGSDVAREAADLVLLDDDFSHIVEAVEEGRAAFDNIRRFLTYHLTDNVAELMPFVAWALSGGRIPLLISVLQVLALDIGTDLLPALALGAERPEPGVMARPPRAPDERLLSRHVLLRAFAFLGPVEAVLSLAMLPIGAALWFGWSWGAPLPAGSDAAVISSALFAAIVLMQMANAFECRSDPTSLFEIGPLSNRLLLVAVALEVLTLLVFVQVTAVADLLGAAPLPAHAWAPVMLTPFVFLGAEELRKLVVRRRYASRQAAVAQVDRAGDF